MNKTVISINLTLSGLLEFLLFTALFLACLTVSQSTIAQEQILNNARIDKTGNFEIQTSRTSSKNDFDFLYKDWVVSNKKRTTLLENANEWFEFEGYCESYGSVLQGIGNIDLFKTTFDGKPFEGLTVRLFNPETKLWTLYWADSNSGTLTPPMTGSFEGNTGWFYGKDTYKGEEIWVAFKWDKTDEDNPVWQQAFSNDKGATWEWNWIAKFSTIKSNPLYGLHGKFIAKEGKVEELSQILLDASDLMKSAKGCRLYVVSLDSNNPNEVWVTEIWDSKEDHDNSLSIPGVRELIGKAIPLLVEMPQKGQEFEILGGVGIR